MAFWSNFGLNAPPRALIFEAKDSKERSGVWARDRNLISYQSNFRFVNLLHGPMTVRLDLSLPGPAVVTAWKIVRKAKNTARMPMKTVVPKVRGSQS